MASPLLTYAIAAFNFRPYGMFIAPNWVGLAIFALLGFVNPGFWLIGLALELTYLLSLITMPRFRAAIDRRGGVRDDAQRESRIKARVERLGRQSQARYHALSERCEAVLDAGDPNDHVETVEHRAEALGTLLGVYLDLLGRAEVVARLLAEADPDIGSRLQSIRDRLSDGDIGPDLKRSLEAQAVVLQERFDAQRTAAEKDEFVASELARVEQQVELLREQTLLDAEPGALTKRIDALTDTLRHTRDWLREQRELDGLVEEPAETEAPVVRAARARRSQQSQ